MQLITIFTPTYNRAYTLPRLYQSLKEQSCKCFEWLIIDDGSKDNTYELIQKWINETKDFQIRYYKTSNGGKQRAINKGVHLAQYSYFFIVDSDDFLHKSAIENIIHWINTINEYENFAGVSGIKCKFNGEYLNNTHLLGENKYIDGTNLEREKYNLTADMAEIYKTEILKKYPFPVWPDEKFTPECVVWDAIALDGYKIRWYNTPIYYCEYLEDGLTKSGYRLYNNNLMGCAMGTNTKLKSMKGINNKFKAIIEVLVACILKGEYRYILQTQYPIITLLLFPIGLIYSYRRKLIIKKYL